MANHDKVALITGAGSGVGRATAIAFLREGYRTVLAGRRREALEETRKLCGAVAERVLVVSCDVTDPKSVSQLFADCKRRFGRLDVLFNNAGVSLGGSIEDVSIKDWLTTLATNLSGPFYCTQEAFRMMKDQDPGGGRIITDFGSVTSQLTTSTRSATAPQSFAVSSSASLRRTASTVR